MLPIVDSVLGIVNKFLPDQETRDKIALEIQKEETKLASMQADLIKREQTSDIWIARAWRPIFSIMLAGMIGGNYILFTVIPTLNVMFDWNLWTMSNPGMEAELWSTIRVCLGGYVGARSAEKIVKILKR